MDKSDLRTHYKEKLENMSAPERSEQSRKISETLKDFLKDQKGIWALYSPLKDEPDLGSLVEGCDHIDWVFPKVKSDTEMDFFHVESILDMEQGHFGILEPKESEFTRISKDQIRGAFVPGLAFDKEGNRLGRGAGYYDRFLSQSSALKVGISFNQNLNESSLPSEKHDQKMNIVISPESWVDVKISMNEVQNDI